MKKSLLAKNSFFFVIYKLLNVLYPLIAITYVSKIILASGVGKVASAQNIVQYFVLIAELGIPNYGIREVAKIRDQKEKKKKFFSELITINTISTIICLILYYGMINMNSFFQNERLLYNIVGISVMMNFFNVDWLYQGIEKFSYITIRSFFVKILSLCGIFLFVHTSSDYIVYAVIYVFGIVGNNLLNFINLKRNDISYTIKNINLSIHIKPVLILLATTVAIELYTMVDTTMLTVMCNDDIVGYYTNSMKIVRLLITVIAAIGGVLLPQLSYCYSVGMIDECEIIVNKVLAVIFYLFMPCGIGLILIADPLVPILFGESFIPSIVTLRIAALLIYALGFSNLFGTQVLLTFGKEKTLLFATLAGAVSNILLNVLLIKVYKQNGAAIASVVSELIVTLITYVYAKKHLDIRLNNSFIIKTFVGCFCMIVTIVIMKIIICNDFLFLSSSIIIGGLVYFGVGIICKNDIMYEIKKLRRREKLNV